MLGQISVKQPTLAMVKWLNFAKQKLKFAKFKPQRSEFPTKFAHQIKTEVVKMFAKNIYQSDTPPPPSQI